MKSLRFLLIPLLGASILAAGFPLHAQGHTYSSDQISQMVAPIALYPDALMSQVLMASTYPNQVAETDQWVRANPNLSGSTLDSALATATWDPSVIALAKFPTVLDRMAQNITWTTDLGNAFLTQRTDVMSAVQALRSAAYENGTLRTNAQESVVTEGPNIVIRPASPEVIYVPTYQPTVVYGSYWNYPSYYYPGVWDPWPGYSFVNGFAWGLGYLFGNILFGGCDWGHHDVWMNYGVINSCSIYHNCPYYGGGYGGGGYGHQQWNHNSGGVDYQNGGTGQPYGGRSRGNINSVAPGNLSRVEPATLRANRGDVGSVDNRTAQRGQAGTTTRDMSRTSQRDMAINTPRDMNRNAQRGQTDPAVRGTGRPAMNDPRGTSARNGMRAPIDPATFPTRGGNRQTGQPSAGSPRQATDRPAAHGPTDYAARGGMRTPIDPTTFPTRGANRQTVQPSAGLSRQDSNRSTAHGAIGYSGQSYNRTTQRGSADYAPRGDNRATVNNPNNFAARGYNRPATNGAPSYSPRGTNRPSSNGSATYSSRSTNRPSPSGPSGYARSGGGQSYSRPSAPSSRASAPSGGHAGGGGGRSGGSHGGHAGGVRR